MKNALNIGCCLTAAFILAAFRGAVAATWHVDSEHGDDAAAGTSPETAWRTLERVNRAKVAPDGGPVGARNMPGLDCDQSLVVRPRLKYEIAMMDVSNEAGPNKATIDDYVCIAGWKSYGALKVMTPSRVTIPLGGGALSLEAEFGVDCRNTVDAPATFRMLASDGRVLHKEEGVKKGKKFTASLDLSGLDSIVLEVSGEPGIMAGWAKTTTFTYAEGKYPPNDVRVHSPQLGILTPPERSAPRINGPVVYGVRPGHPIIYRVPVTGERPMKVSLVSPSGYVFRQYLQDSQDSRNPVNLVNPVKEISFDPESRIITGSIKEPGEYPLTIIAENAKGRASRDFIIKVGDRISLTPAMGWNSWNCFGWNVTADDICNAADALEKSGLAEHGWSYVNIDDFWQNKPSSKDVRLQGPERDENGRINSNKRFPDMKGIADYIHAKGFKAGLYSSPGPTTCGGCTGSWQHEAQDAKTYADWGFDYLKHDWCSYWNVATVKAWSATCVPTASWARRFVLKTATSCSPFASTACQMSVPGARRSAARAGASQAM